MEIPKRVKLDWVFSLDGTNASPAYIFVIRDSRSGCTALLRLDVKIKTVTHHIIHN